VLLRDWHDARMNIFEALRLSHDTQRALATQILETQGDSPDRQRLYRELKHELAAHAAAEERCFYSPLIDHDESMAQARHGMAEHHEMDELVDELNATDFSSSGWLTLFKKLHHKVYHHLEDEEHAIFQLAGKLLTEAQKTSLAKAYEEEFVNFRMGEMPINSAEG
jgi:hemerythrin superfamily protein